MSLSYNEESKHDSSGKKRNVVAQSMDLDKMPDSGPNPRSSNLTIEVEKVSDDSNSRVQKIELDESETSSMYEAK